MWWEYSNTTECFAEVATTTDERHFKVMFRDMVDFICWSQHFTLINVINPNCLEDLQHKRSQTKEMEENDTCASTKCPIRTFAMTGMLTASIISLIIFGSDMRATPPCFLISAGTLSKAMTAQAPASSAILACSALKR